MKAIDIKTEIEKFLNELKDTHNIPMQFNTGFGRGYFEGHGWIGLDHSGTRFGFAIETDGKHFHKNDSYGKRHTENTTLEGFKSEIMEDIKQCLMECVDWAEGWGHSKQKYRDILESF